MPIRGSLLRYESRSRSSGQYGVDIVQCQHPHRHASLHGRTADMRQQKRVLKLPISWMDLRFSVEYVQSGGGHLSAPEGSNQIFVYHQPTACRVDDDRAAGEQADGFGIQEVASLWSFGSVQTKKLAKPKEFVRVFMINRVFFEAVGQLCGIAIVNLHPEPPRATRHRLPYFTHSKNAQHFAAYLPAQQHVRTQRPPSSCSNEFLRLVSATRSTQEQQHGNIRRCFAVGAWCICDGDLLLRRPLQVNVIKPHRIGGDDSYCRRNPLEEGGIQVVQESDEYSVSPVYRRQKLLSGERSRIRIAPWFVVAVDTVFNFLWKLACDNQNWFRHVGVSDFGPLN